MENILEPIVSSPKLSLYVEQLQTLLNKEKTIYKTVNFKVLSHFVFYLPL